MGEILKQSVVVENRSGAGGNLGAQLAAHAPADGYTWVYSGSPMATNMRMYRKPGFDVMKDFTHIGRITQSDSVVLVNADSGVNTMQDLLERMRKAPGKLAFGSGGVGTPSHLGAELLLSATGAQALHVPYKGASETTTAVVGKQVDFTLALVGAALTYIDGGKLKPLAVLSPKRNSRLPDVPTLAEAGVPDVLVVSFGGVSVPKGTPTPVVERIREALGKALESPEVQTKIEATGATVAPSTSEEFTDAMRAEIALTEQVMKVADIDPQ
jgi:tripartite-type tricarboxylate transporter receptor subunit TctC